MASGFRGTRPGLTELAVKGSFIETTVTFSDEEGKVHGYMNHKLEVGAHPEVQRAAAELMRVTLRVIENYHYTSPDSPHAPKEVKSGIAEALRGDTNAAHPGEPEDEGGPRSG